MIGLGFREHGGLDRVEMVEVAEPVPGPGEVRIRVKAAAFNRLDRFTLRGIPGVSIELPHLLGSDAAGVVDSVGPGVVDLPVGTEVLVDPGMSDGTCDYCRRGARSFCRNFQILGEHTQGSAGPFIRVPRRNVYARPERLTFSEAAAVPLVFQTTWRALATVAGVTPGERVAIVGAGGVLRPRRSRLQNSLGALLPLPPDPRRRRSDAVRSGPTPRSPSARTDRSTVCSGSGARRRGST